MALEQAVKHIVSNIVNVKKLINGRWGVYVGSKKYAEHTSFPCACGMAEYMRANNVT